MKPSYLTFFGFLHEPFGADIRIDQILQTPEVLAVSDRLEYTVRLGAIGLVTGDVGSGKSTALRWALSRLHPSEYRPLWITASSDAKSSSLPATANKDPCSSSMKPLF
ncbi:hypothetical protein [Desulforhabdus amnigena]|jgi:type II secretory pathway predicted ATPase ExeA|uniref:Uncharacterized protein n=1 Tax=Desulforhabdus amnigena TaxID=40218 RepID=A0A9W6D1G6_9BACT|nr:hypothetical protein [Desulforhabdus amnigena]GLI32570.1 hypothetical protein DAMNIGENAA_00030 [Desulforhabdus amnigena]GLI34125.1 hypothetical protein DAMNIGENAA_15580 [Desulforhabdus amnigena]